MSVVPTLNIKDPEVYRLAAELAERRGTSMTGAVRAALRQSLEQDAADREERHQRMLEIMKGSREKIEREGIVFLTDDDLYDEKGLPH